MASSGGSDVSICREESGISKAMTIIHTRMRNTAVERELRSVTRGIRISDSVKADVVISMVGGACAFQMHINFSHGHVADAVARAEQLATSFERCYVLLVRPNTDALQNFQLQLSPSCDARPLLVTSERNIVPEIQRVAQGVLNQASKIKRREYYKQVHHELRTDEPHRGILAELLRGLGVREWKKEADLLLDTFGSIRSVCLQPLSSLLSDCPIAGETARLVHAFFNEKPSPPLPCTMCPGEPGGCRLLPT